MEKFIPSQCKILIVDDNTKNIHFLGNTLTKEKYEIEFATNGMKALEWIKKLKFDLILLDIMMPEMNGFEVCEQIRSNPKFKDMPIIFLTANTDQESILRGFEVGGQDYITKPFTPRELLARVKTQLELKFGKEQIQKVNEWLEERVKEKTLQLQDSNKQLEKANVELLDFDKAKTEFLKIISHEIRTPLNGMLVPIQLLKEELITSNLAELIEILDLSVSRLEKFAQRALLITDLKTNKYKLTLKEISVKQIIESVINSAASKLQKRNISVKIERIPENLTVSGDFELLKICFEGIFDNAIKYSDDGSEISIRIYQKGHEISIETIDRGKGFSDEALRKLFRLFTQGDSHIDQNLGLDLALIKLIMDAHKGKINVTNTKTGGASAILTLNKRNHGSIINS